MPATGRTAFGRMMMGQGRQPGTAAVNRLQALLDQIRDHALERDTAVLGALRDRARTALAETAAQAASLPTVKTVHDALQAALPPLERRIIAVSGQGPQISGHRAAPPANPLGDPPPAIAHSVTEEDSRRAQGHGRVEPVEDVAPPAASPMRDEPARASGYGRMEPVVDAFAPVGYTVPADTAPPANPLRDEVPSDGYSLADDDAPRVQGYGRAEPLADAAPPANPLRDEVPSDGYSLPDDEAPNATGYGREAPVADDPLASISINYSASDAAPPARGDGRGAPASQPPSDEMYTLENDGDDDDEAPAEQPVAYDSVQIYGSRARANPAPEAPSNPPQPPADGFARRAALHEARRAALHDIEAPEDREARASASAAHIARELKFNSDVLSADEHTSFSAELAAANRLADPSAKADTLDALRRAVDTAVGARMAEINALIADLKRIEPLAARALKLLAADPVQRQAHAELTTAWTALKAELATPQGGVATAREHLDLFEARARQLLDGISLDAKRAEQAASLEQDPAKPLALGAQLGAGHFGRVVELGGDKHGTPLVGKALIPGGDLAQFKKEIEHEEEIYAQVGEHPNIAKCYGIQVVDGEQVLVMEKISGPKLDAVFGTLEERYRKGKINREEYLGALQQLVRGTLEGLAQFESMGMTHRDIKDDNIILDETTMQPKLVDMGLSQAHGKRKNPMQMVLGAPPEANAGSQEVDDKWDTYTVAKMLFPHTELDPVMHDPGRATEATEHHQFVPGLEGAQVSAQVQGAWMPDSLATPNEVRDAAKRNMIKNPDGSFSATVGENGEYVDQPLHPAPGNAKHASPGQFAMDSAYVDFMNRLAHPDPALRMSAAEALKHPFMTQQFGDPDKLKKALGQPAPQPAQGPGDGGGIKVNYQNTEDTNDDAPVNYRDDDDRPVIYKND